jgi:hypothetical protein
MSKQTGQQVILNSGFAQHLIVVPTGGLLVRLQVVGNSLVPSFEGEGQPSAALHLITAALQRLKVDQIVNVDRPFAPYNPGSVVT